MTAIDQSAAAHESRAPSPHSEADREIRFGLVLYGGVSLAVYIYGVVLEFERLVRASCGVETNAWTKILKDAGVTATVDIVSGASAGGINGVLLGKALATGARLDSVRSIWTEKADIGALLREAGEKEPRSLLRVDLFEELLTDGLEEMDTGATGKPLASAFDLFVAATRLQPWERGFPTDLGGTVKTRDYRKSFELKLRSSGYNPQREDAGYDRNDFDAAGNLFLAEVARASSAFPVAFEPQLIEQDASNEQFFQDGEPGKSYFSDGGILHNRPFTETISTIFTRAASRPVDRWLVSVEPDPELLAPPASEDEPNVAEVASKAVLGIPRYQSIAADLTRLQEHRRRAEIAREKLAGIDEALLSKIDALQQPDEAEDGPLHAWTKEVLAASDYRDQRRLRAWQALKRRAATATNAQAWDEDAIDKLDDAVAAGTLPVPDPGFEQRRIYRLLEMTRELQNQPGLPDDARLEVAEAKLRLWGQFDRVDELLWELFDGEGGSPATAPPKEPAEALAQLGTDLAGVATEVGVVCGQLDELSAAVPGGTGEPGRFSKVFRWFELWDAQLLTIEEVSGAGARDEINFARISPADTTYIAKAPEAKLAGDMLGHFSGFLKQGWRENDLLWGRLDAAEVICRMLMGPVEGDASPPLPEADIAAVQKEICKEELDNPPDDYRAYLEDDYTIGEETLGDLPLEERVDLALRSGGVTRNMLRGLSHEKRLPGRLKRLISWLGRGLGLLLAVARGPIRAWARLSKALGK